MKLPDVSGLLVACDTEGSGLFNDDGARVSVVSAAWRDPSGQLVSIAVPFDQGVTDLPLGPKVLPRNHERRLAKWAPEDLTAPNKSPRAWDNLVRWLLRQHLIFQNGKHDLLQFLAGQRDRPQSGLAEFHPPFAIWDGGAVDLEGSVVWDTMLASGQLWPGHPVGLKDTSVRLHLGESLGILEGDEASEAEALGPWKGPSTDPRYDLIPWSVLGPYARRDAELTYILAERQMAEAEGTPTQIRIEEEVALMRTLYRMEVRGVGFDRDGCLNELAKLDKLIAEAAALVPFRGGVGRPTPPAAVKYFFGDPPDGLGLIPFSDKMTKGGKTRGPQPQVDEEAVSRLVKLNVPGAKEFAHYQELMSARSKWYAAFPDLTGPDGRLRTSHKQGSVVSGRLAVQRWQAQALPHSYQIPDGLQPIRDFISYEDPDCYETWEADASQAEIRVATYVAKERNMLLALRRGIDSHSAACKLMFYPSTSLEEAQVTKDWDFYRQVAKRCNLGILYGVGAKELAVQIAKFTGIDISLAQSRAFIDDWKQAFPGFARALHEFSDMATESGYVRLCTGKVRKFADYEPVHKAFNQRVQGDVSEAMRIAMVKFDRLYPGMLLLQIHDSLVARIPCDQVPEIKKVLPSMITDTFSNLFSPVPFKADVKPFGYSEHFLKGLVD